MGKNITLGFLFHYECNLSEMPTKVLEQKDLEWDNDAVSEQHCWLLFSIGNRSKPPCK